MLNHDSRPVGLEAIVGADVLIDEHLWIEAGYCHELAEYGELDEEAYVARQMGQPEQGIRAWLIERLNRLAGAWRKSQDCRRRNVGSTRYVRLN